MPWVRLDENAIDHPKFLALSDGAWRLWVEGLAYCQKHLTDGMIPTSALRKFRHYTSAKFKQLCQPYQPGANALWRVSDDHAVVLVHDYLAWNESRSDVLLARQQAHERRQRYRDKNAALDAYGDATGTRPRTANVACGVPCNTGTSSSEAEPDLSRTRELEINPIAARAQSLSDLWAELHDKYRGVPYIGNPRKDYEEACALVAKFTDEQLRNAAVVFLNADDEFARSRTATLAMFRSRVPWCLERIRARGIA